MATEVTLVLRFEREVDIEDLEAEVAAALDCTVIGSDVEEDI